MVRLLAIVAGVLLVASTASAQVFKPRGGTKPAGKTATATPAKKTTTDQDGDDKPDKATKAKATKAKGKPAAAADDADDAAPVEKKPTKKAARTTATTSRHTPPKSTKKSRAATSTGRPDDLTPDPVPKGGDPDYVVITDDDDE